MQRAQTKEFEIDLVLNRKYIVVLKFERKNKEFHFFVISLKNVYKNFEENKSQHD